MNIIINGFHKPEYFDIIRNICDFLMAEQCHIIFETEKVQLPPKTWVNYYGCANLSHQYEYPTVQNILPLDGDLVEQLNDCEAVCLKMMERDEISGEWSYDKRKFVYLTHLRYWNHVIQTQNIACFIASNIPHVVYDYVIYSLCKLKGIRTILFYQFHTGLSFIMEDWKEPTPGLKQKVQNTIKHHTLKELEDLELSPRMLFDVQVSAGTAPAPVPFYMLRNDNETGEAKRSYVFAKTLGNRIVNAVKSPARLFKLFIKSPYIMLREYQNSRTLSRQTLRLKILNDDYEQRCVHPDFTKDYVYFPIHFQPELSTSPMGGAFVDQWLIVQILDFFLPQDVLIYVKEHPNQRIELRQPHFYPQMAVSRRVHFISRKQDSKQMISSARAVATCTGTAGWEALLSQKPVLMFGYTFYQDAPGVYPIRVGDDCANAVRDIWHKNTAPNSGALRAFLHHLDQYAVYGNIDPDYMDSNHPNWSDNADLIFKAIKKQLSNTL